MFAVSTSQTRLDIRQLRAIQVRASDALLLVVGLGYICAFVGTGILRAIYPYPIDGVEPGALQEVRRVLQGQPLYVQPQLGYIPLIYGPVYFYASALVASLGGPPLFSMRLLSVAASLGSIGVLVLLVRRETGSLTMGLVSGGLFAACGPLVDMAMDIGRMDALSLCFLLGAVYLARTPGLVPGASWRYGAGCGALVGLSLLTKQSGVPVALALGVLFTLTAQRQVVPYVLAVCLVVGVAMLLLTAQSGRWPLFYLWDLPRRHEFKAAFASQFWSQVVRRFAVPIVVGPFFFFTRFRAGDYRRLVFYLCVCLGLVLTAWLQDANVGTGRNVEMPAYAAFALLFGLALSEAIRYLSVPSERARTARAYIVFMAVAQFAIVLYNPRLVVPYRSDLWAAQRMNTALAGLPGPTFAGSYQGYVDDSAQAPDLGALRELEGAFGGTGTDEAGYWEGLFSGAMAQRQVTYIIIDPENAASIVPTLARDYGYRHVGPLFTSDDIFWAWRTAWTPKAEVYVAPENRPTVQR